MNIGKAYSYLFYKLYKFWEWASTPKFWSNWKAELTIDVLEILLGFSLVSYYTAITKSWVNFLNNSYSVLFYIVIIAIPNHYFFHHRIEWKETVKEFDQWPERKNQIGSIIVGMTVAAVIANFIFAFYLLSEIGPPNK